MYYSLESGVRGRSTRQKWGRLFDTNRGKLITNGLFMMFMMFGSATVVSGQMTKAEQPKPTPTLYASTASVVTPTELKPVIVIERFDSEQIQSAVDSWSRKNPTASVVVADTDGAVLGSSQAQTPYFMASIYKLYVAYFGYQAIDAGIMNGTDVITRGMTREQCLDAMIRTSDSPCGEKVMSELGKANIQAKLVALGFIDTSMGGLTTSAKDAALMLQKIQRGEGLSALSQQKLLASMQSQKYRNALPKGFTGLEVYNKVGFNELKEYHDVAIVKLSDGTPIIVSVLTKNTGNKSIAQLASLLQQATQAQ